MDAKKTAYKLMKNALPQPGIVGRVSQSDLDLAKLIFPGLAIDAGQLGKTRINPSGLVVYCKDRLSSEWKGRSLRGMSKRFCQDFFTTPTDVGHCVTKNIMLGEILSDDGDGKGDFQSVFEAFRGPVVTAYPGTEEGRTTVVIDTRSSRTFSRTSSAIDEPNTWIDELGEVRMQLHDGTRSLGQMLISPDMDKSKQPLTLESAKEYTVGIRAVGREMTSRFSEYLDQETQDCHLPSDPHDLRLFSEYSQANCFYECRVATAGERCGCVPWDYLDPFLPPAAAAPVCDVFGATCFGIVLREVTKSIGACACKKDCVGVQYSKEILSVKDISLDDGYGYGGSQSDSEKWFASYGAYQTGELAEYLGDPNSSVGDPRYVTAARQIARDSPGATATQRFGDVVVVHFEFVSPEYEVLVTDARVTWMEKMADLGGTLGLLTQFTGCSLLTLIQLLLLLAKALHHTTADLLHRHKEARSGGDDDKQREERKA